MHDPRIKVFDSKIKPSYEFTSFYGINKNHPLARGLVGCWVMNESAGGIVFDLSGNVSPRDVSSIGWTDSELGYFDGSGTGDHIILPDTFLDGIDDVTVVCGLRLDCVDANQWIFSSADGDGAVDRFMMGVSSSGTGGKLFIYDDINDRGTSIQSTSGYFSAGQNDFAIVTYQLGKNVGRKMFYNGIQDGFEAYYTTGPDDASPSANGIIISGYLSADYTQEIKGYMRFFYVYNGEVTPAEIAWISREPYAMFYPDIKIYPVGVTVVNNTKLSLISYQQPFNTPIPVSADGLGQGDKQHLIWNYSNILWSGEEIIQIANATISQVAQSLNVNAETLLTISPASLSIIGQSLNINESEIVAITQAAISQVGQALNILESETVQISQAVISQVGQSLTVLADEIISIAQATLSQVGQSLTVNAQEVVPISQASISQAGQAVNINASEQIQIAQAAISQVGQTLNVVADEIIPIGSAQMLMAGKDLVVNMQEQIQIAQATISQAGQSLNIIEGQQIQIATATLSIVGETLNVVEEGIEALAYGIRKLGQTQEME